MTKKKQKKKKHKMQCLSVAYQDERVNGCFTKQNKNV